MQRTGLGPTKLAFGILCFNLVAGASYGQEACTTYKVKEGDTLGSISQAAYGTYDYQMIFNANRNTLVDNFNNLPIGLELILPCKDGRLTADTELNSVTEAAEEKQAATRDPNKPYEPAVKLLSGSGWKPFTDDTLQGGGILVRLASTALHRGGNDRDSKIAWVDDWSSHMTSLLPSKAYDVSIAWAMPDCTKIDLLGEESVSRCTEFVASEPIYEVADTMTTLADSKYATAESYEDLYGAKVCKPADWSTFPLEEAGLVEPNVTLVRLKSPADCAKAVLSGEVDVMAIELETATDVFTELNAMDKVAINPTLVRFLTFHFITSKDNPRGKKVIEMLNAGLTEMRETGEWYDIVAAGLAEYNGATN